MTDEEARTKTIYVSVNAEEKALVFNEAKRKGLHASAWIRSVLLEVVREETPQAKSA
jgi:hypothetical protein